MLVGLWFKTEAAAKGPCNLESKSSSDFQGEGTEWTLDNGTSCKRAQYPTAASNHKVGKAVIPHAEQKKRPRERTGIEEQPFVGTGLNPNLS